MTTLRELEDQLAVAQANKDRWTEGKLINQIVRIINPIKGANQNSGLNVQQRFFRRVAFGIGDCMFWCGSLDTGGYGIMIAIDEVKAHRVSWRIHNGDIPKNLKVLHKCDVRNCVNPEHLFLGTQADNVRDCIAKGRKGKPNTPTGERSHLTKYSDKLVAQIRSDFKTGKYTQIYLAKKYGVSAMNVSRYIRNTMRKTNV